MLNEYQHLLTAENIYLWTNYGVLPFWLMLIIIPNSKFTQFFLNSVVIPLILTTAYIYIVYQIFILDEPFFDVFKIYVSLDNLYTLFSVENFLLVFWLHFLALNLFLGNWIVRNGIKYNMPRGLIIVPLILVYFTGPLGLVLYWFLRIFYAKRLTFDD